MFLATSLLVWSKLLCAGKTFFALFFNVNSPHKNIGNFYISKTIETKFLAG